VEFEGRQEGGTLVLRGVVGVEGVVVGYFRGVARAAFEALLPIVRCSFVCLGMDV
jgi:hypothetical protein